MNERTCTGALEWHQIQGMVLAREVGGRKVYDYRCPACGARGAAQRLRKVCGGSGRKEEGR